ncbi:amino acid permease [Carboxylicivirga sp. N1Y90]|uniref:amino acid permease n=1 Tax=Carboxylicivirga fragile TaxID=3417571 RepID=UPI003D32E8EA|nr:amino acid permease [Marinilabiliaceae bacterium N1Y90]
MAKLKKFGTFSGVFTPSILTILGVIMYLRFPAIIGQAGLINTIGIIFIAHIISITTSLSVASLSTDKPVQNGGTYFMISRSLGLPIGGTLGWALFVGLSFSVSLYLIGFAESFLQYWEMELTINTIRITGSIVLLAVTTITFVSTSLAIKSQYFIMAAIVLSLLSIFFGKHDFVPQEINIAPLATAAPFMVLFGIFFPAVTVFEAGVSMSGDLQNPKKSLPYGAMLAVGVGFIVYIALAFFYAYTVDANALVNDPQILFKISLVPALVIAGIWGATLSSALGSILGAPRILQAIAMDKIAPKTFAKGTGKTNEPRNALLLAFVIAEAGILIGELDVIARIVSMFFITTYAFLNLASVIESWSSSDFRPAFKIPRIVSILGTLSAFFVMILLDFVALAGATVALGLLYFYLQRKELILESGDAWSSFWTNLAKKALLKLSIQKDNKRNWRPNIILFSGGEKARPYLVEIGLALSGKLGALTDFKLSSSEEQDRNIHKHTQLKKNKKGHDFFVRQLECSSVKEGIKSITNIYGFSGFEPNTVLLGWSKSNGNTGFMSDVLKDFKTKKLNAIFLDYDKNNGFGKKESIDIWWNGKGRHLSFSLNILRFLLSDKSWRDANVRIMIINSDTSLNDNLYRNTNAILIDKRIQAEIKVISDDFGSRTKEEIINSESANADLIVLGLSQSSHSYTNEYIEKVNTIFKLPASILLLSPSDEFEETNLIDHTYTKSRAAIYTVALELPQLPNFDSNLVKNRIEKLDEDLMEIGNDFCNQSLKSAVAQMQSMVLNLYDFSSHILNTLQKELNESGKHEYQKVIDRNHINYLRHVLKITQSKNATNISEAEAILQNGISLFLTRLGNYKYEATESVTISFQIPGKKKEKVMEFPFRKAMSYYEEVKMD